MAFRNLFRSAQLSTLMNRLGHSESYSFALELETAIVNSLQESSFLLTPEIKRDTSLPSVLHSDFDNFDKFVNNISGSRSIHTAHGIMMQDNDGSFDSEKIQITLHTITKSGERSLKIILDGALPPCYVNHRDCPKMEKSRTVTPIDKKLVYCKPNRINQIWCLLRLMCGTDEQAISGWSEIISETGVQPKRHTTIDYYPGVHHITTENSLNDSGTQKKLQEKLGKSMLSQLMSAYIKMIRKKMTGSGVTEILLEAELPSSSVVNLTELYKDRNEKNVEAVLCDYNVQKLLSEFRHLYIK
ncbi:hypothetical protein LOTGIDRAFT_170608 [Lottia gigantea]|uniref:Uncharacterized protein n=1 Tax=Lottia gigantea TaxID=225164 RepID=V4BFI9_LOTGI|nr:hypothetical protein LOTGIDRAFT_170608 [Lottia gigantea]ESP04637.1 hypothetical protein LOTGIDRAFT_170608 [Lottia gigantea]